MRIIGIDPGFAILGWAVIDDSIKLVDFGSIETTKDMQIDERLFVIYSELKSIIERHKPERAVIERLFFTKNTTSAMDVSKAVGVVLLVFRQYALPYREYSPLQVKQAITGYGKASKKQVQFMIMKLFNLKELPEPDDAADALAIAFCGALVK